GAATAPGRRTRGSACRARIASNAAAGMSARAAGVSVSPGATQVTAIPSGPCAMASARARATSAPLLVTYGSRSAAGGAQTVSETTKTIRPKPRRGGRCRRPPSGTGCATRLAGAARTGTGRAAGPAAPARAGDNSGLQAESLADVRYVAPGDRDGLVGARVGGQEQGSLEPGLDLPHPAEVDQEPAVHPDEPLVGELLLEPVEAAGGGQEPAPVGHQPAIVVVGLGQP